MFTFFKLFVIFATVFFAPDVFSADFQYESEAIAACRSRVDSSPAIAGAACRTCPGHGNAIFANQNNDCGAGIFFLATFSTTGSPPPPPPPPPPPVPCITGADNLPDCIVQDKQECQLATVTDNSTYTVKLCITTPTPDCSLIPNSWLNIVTNQCESCSASTVLVGGQCVTPNTCPVGKTKDMYGNCISTDTPPPPDTTPPSTTPPTSDSGTGTQTGAGTNTSGSGSNTSDSGTGTNGSGTSASDSGTGTNGSGTGSNTSGSGTSASASATVNVDLSVVNSNTAGTLSKMTDLVSDFKVNSRESLSLLNQSATTLSKIFNALSDAGLALDVEAIRNDVDKIRVYNELIHEQLIRQSAAMDTHYKTFADFKFTYDKSYDQQLLTAKDIKSINDTVINIDKISTKQYDILTSISKSISDIAVEQYNNQKKVNDYLELIASYNKLIADYTKVTGDNAKLINDNLLVIKENIKVIGDDLKLTNEKIDNTNFRLTAINDSVKLVDADIKLNTDILKSIDNSSIAIKSNTQLLNDNVKINTDILKSIDNSDIAVKTNTQLISDNLKLTNQGISDSLSELKKISQYDAYINANTNATNVSVKSIDANIKITNDNLAKSNTALNAINDNLKIESDSLKENQTLLKAVNNTLEISNTSKDIKQLLQDSKPIDLSKVEKNTLDTATNTKAISDTLTDAFKERPLDSDTSSLQQSLQNAETALLADVTNKLSDNSGLDTFKPPLLVFAPLYVLFPSSSDSCKPFVLPFSALKFSTNSAQTFSYDFKINLCVIVACRVILEWVIYALTALYVFNASIDVSMTKD